mgnify:CR=1 FL=1
MERPGSTPEIDGLPTGLIYTPEQFDAKMLSGQFPLTDLIACHSHKTERIQMDFRDEDMERKQWIQLFPKQVKQIGFGRFSHRLERYYIPPVELLRANRVDFAHEIQVVYGGLDLEGYIAGLNPRQDPEWFGAVRLERRIPATYIKVIIPF